MKEILDWLKQALSAKPAMKESYCRIEEGSSRMPQKQVTKLN